ncbi:MAG: oligosaccharide flippase family protein [Anaerolineae bacterium]
MNSETIRGNLRGYLRVGKNALARLSAQAWTKLLSLVLVPLVARYEGSTGLGRYMLVTTVVGIISVLSDMGLKTLLTREAASTQTSMEQRTLLGNLLPLRLVLAVGGYLLVMALTWIPFLPVETRRLLPLGGLMLLPDGFMGMIEALMNGRRRMDMSSGLQMATRLLTVVGAVPALMLNFGIQGLLISTLIANVIGVGLYLSVLWRWELQPNWDVNLTDWRVMLTHAYPFALTGLIAVIYTRLDVVLLSAWQGEAAAGWYSAAYKLWEAFGLVPSSLLDALFPEMARLASTSAGRVTLERLFHRSVPALGISGMAISGVAVFLADEIVYLFYGPGENYIQSIVAFRVLVWAIPAMFLYLLSGHTLYALGRQHRVTGAMLIVGLANITLNLWAIPQWSYLGVSGVALFSAWLLWILLYIPAQNAVHNTEEHSEDTGHSEVHDYLDTARAFDIVAGDYDAVYGPTGNAVMTWMRRENLQLLTDIFPPDSHLLEIGCGTGEEAVTLAQIGRRVLATDISPQMAAQAQGKAKTMGVGDRVRVLALPAGNLAILHPTSPFDGAYASFGALNCEPRLEKVATGLARLVKPGGHFICSVMTRWCPFEIAWYLLHGRPRVAFRRLQRGWQSAPVAGQESVEVSVLTRYLSVGDVTKAFAPHFTVEQTLALPILLPPPYLDTLYQRHRTLFDRLEPWERWLRGRWPWRLWGDHVVLVLRRV